MAAEWRIKLRIQVNDGEKHNIKILLPTSLIFSDLTAMIACKVIEHSTVSSENGEVLDPKTKALITNAIKGACRALRQTKKKYHKFVLVDVESATGEKVLITL